MKQKRFFNKSGVLGVMLFLSGTTHANTNETLFLELRNNQPVHVENVLSMYPHEYPPYKLFIQSPEFQKIIRNKYDKEQIDTLIQKTIDTRKIFVVEKPWGTFIQATSFEDDNIKSETHYDAVWVRDSLWGYLALNLQKETQETAKKVLITLWDYMSTSAQTERMDNIIKDPAVLDDINGQMNALHIRFDSNSSDFSDVKDGDKPQQWNHKQNDALGLFLDNIIQAVRAGQLTSADWEKNNRLDSIIKLIAYLDRARFYEMSDSGAWEEEERLNTSSVALVTSGLENLINVFNEQKNANAIKFRDELTQKANELKLSEYIKLSRLEGLVDKGYNRVTYQLKLGGESPDHKKSSTHYRTADAALLNLIYPANLSRLTLEQKKTVLSIVRTLAGSYGIKRYLNDNYQAANFWFNDINTDTSKNSHDKRRKMFIPFTEAQWFFDSWYAIASANVYKESNEKYYLNEAIQFTNRSLAQITGKNMKGANGRPVPAMALPESINFLHFSGKLQPVPSPITPLNWSKASMTLMFAHLKPILPDNTSTQSLPTY